MISHTYKYILITPPKTGSSTIVDALKPYSDIINCRKPKSNGYNSYNYIDEFRHVAPRLSRHGSKHITISEICTELASRGVDISNYMKIGVIRNPFDQMISFWKWRYKKHEYKLKKTFPEFLKHRLSRDRDSHGNPILNSAYFKVGSRYIMDIYIRFESLNHDYNMLCNKLSLPTCTLRHLNKTSHKHYSTYYTPETRELVNHYFADDIEYFNYTFDQHDT